jgi:hypothetical protein
MHKEKSMEIFSRAEIPLDPATLSKQIHMSDQNHVCRLWDSVRSAITPKAAFRVGFVDEKRGIDTVIDGVRFSSRVLSRNLEGVGRVFPYVLTLGAASDELIANSGDMLDNFLMGEIMNIALRAFRREFEEHMRAKFALNGISRMSPGSLEDWPIEEQKNLFSLMPGVESAAGVRLTETFLMIPRKSVSGIYFPSETTFLSCQLCPREKCVGRKAPYDEAKARDYGILGAAK